VLFVAPWSEIPEAPTAWRLPLQLPAAGHTLADVLRPLTSLASMTPWWGHR